MVSVRSYSWLQAFCHSPLIVTHHKRGAYFPFEQDLSPQNEFWKLDSVPPAVGLVLRYYLICFPNFRKLLECANFSVRIELLSERVRPLSHLHGKGPGDGQRRRLCDVGTEDWEP